MGIDRYSFSEHRPIQVQRSERVGRNVVDNFQRAVERADKDTGYRVAFSFTRGAREEVARVKQSKGLEIILMEVAELLKDTTSLITPVSGQPVLELPLPPARPKEARPSAEELVESDQTAEEVA